MRRNCYPEGTTCLPTDHRPCLGLPGAVGSKVILSPSYFQPRAAGLPCTAVAALNVFREGWGRLVYTRHDLFQRHTHTNGHMPCTVCTAHGWRHAIPPCKPDIHIRSKVDPHRLCRRTICAPSLRTSCVQSVPQVLCRHCSHTTQAPQGTVVRAGRRRGLRYRF